MSDLPVFIGYDSREQAAYDVAVKTLRETATVPVAVTPLRLDALRDGGLLWRRTERLAAGSIWDCVSQTPTSTEFSVSRFLVPIMQRTGWCLFTDCDVVFLRDVRELFDLADERYAVMVVKHEHAPAETEKMDGAVQRRYRRKNWASVVLWQCDHPAHRRLDLGMVNTWPRDLLSQFSWLLDEEIGELPAECNWLVGAQPKPDNPVIAHLTRGGPWIPNWTASEHDDIWLKAAEGIWPLPTSSAP